MAQIDRAMEEVAQQVALSRGINIVLNRAQVLGTTADFDLTPEVAKVLNKILPKVDIPPEGVSPVKLHPAKPSELRKERAQSGKAPRRPTRPRSTKPQQGGGAAHALARDRRRSALLPAGGAPYAGGGGGCRRRRGAAAPAAADRRGPAADGGAHRGELPRQPQICPRPGADPGRGGDRASGHGRTACLPARCRSSPTSPMLAWARVAALFHPLPPLRPGIHPAAVVDARRAGRSQRGNRPPGGDRRRRRDRAPLPHCARSP